jgi:hypothetical protein
MAYVNAFGPRRSRKDEIDIRNGCPPSIHPGSLAGTHNELAAVAAAAI